MTSPSSRAALRRFGQRGVVTLLTIVLLTACGGAAATSPTKPVTTPAVSGASAPATSAPVGQKVNVNTATVAELQRAFETAGITNAARWAREVEEYRPYPTNDPTFAKLRGELAKYNPAPGVVDQIVATLSL